jgi:tetratricopeptide (TPR) repeat protein
MSFLKNLFTKKEEPFSEGDIFYTMSNQQYQLHKVLKADVEYGTYHVMIYALLPQLPPKDQQDSLQVLMHHAPIAMSGFEDPKLFAKSVLSHDDFLGYYEYLRQTQNFNELVPIAKGYYREAYRLTDLKQHEAAIDHYTWAIELIPDFYEAIDNRAFCYMDLGRWDKAMKDFKLSLSVHADSFLAEFSIGECLFKAGNFALAIRQFEKAIDLDPSQQIARDFLKKAIEAHRA